jgi:hypothetical protein
MKKLQIKLPKLGKKQVASTRITNETVAEHREQVLAGGRKYKYPVQYLRHRLVINTVIIAVFSLIIVSVLFWWQLYIAQNSSDLVYRVTRVLPLSVASVDGEAVRFSDYLRRYRSTEYYYINYDKIKIDSDDGKRQLNYARRTSLDNVIGMAYAAKLAREKNISVSESEIDVVIERERTTVNGMVSQQAYDSAAKKYYNWDADEYRLDTKEKLLEQKVAYAIDTAADTKQKQAAELVKAQNANFTEIATTLGGVGSAKVQAGATGLIDMSSSYRGLNNDAAKLTVGAVSQVVKSSTGDGYYFLRLTAKTETQISYEFVFIPLTTFNEQLANLKSSGKIQEFITIKTD